ncbi:MAG: response regulator [Acidobacteria bacterium]|nr:response regulator [Acidobacteriota bacterium]
MNPSIKVLYAEDNPQDAELTCAHFAEVAPDFAIEIAATGEQCLVRLRQQPFDLLLLDHHLPDIDGLELFQTLIHEDAEIPVVLVTGVGSQELVVKALRLGAVDYVPKHNGYLDELPPLLRRLVAEERQRQQMGLRSKSSTRQVLYIEDNAMDADLTVTYCREAAPRMKFQLVRNCEEALVILRQRSDFDIILLDLFFAGLNGLDFLRQLRKEGLEFPVIAVTSIGNEESALAALRLGVEEYLPKHDAYLLHLASILEPAIVRFQLRRFLTEERAMLSQRVLDLEAFLSICASCKKIREPGADPKKPNNWMPIENYLARETHSSLTHSICPDCGERLYGKLWNS